jgi:hypothetical protein
MAQNFSVENVSKVEENWDKQDLLGKKLAGNTLIPIKYPVSRSTFFAVQKQLKKVTA